MSGNVQWLPKTPTEVVVRFADYTDELAAGESVVGTPAVTTTVWSGNDGAPAIIGPITAVANTAGVIAVASVTVQAGVQGTIYQCVVTATTSASRVITKTALIAVKPPMP